jgi:hypothetical protein
MANFLHGLGDVWGIPMWAFYVNRGQGEPFFPFSNEKLNFCRHHFFWKTEQRFSCRKIRDGKLLFVLFDISFSYISLLLSRPKKLISKLLSLVSALS